MQKDDSSPREKDNSHEPEFDGEDFTFAKVVDCSPDDNMFRLCCEGCAAKDETQETTGNLPFIVIRAFFRRKRRAIPENVRRELPQDFRDV